ncbi:MAG: DinB family protein [Pirellulaceae bacterium]
MTRPLNHDASLRTHLQYLLNGGGAHIGFEDAISGIAPEYRGAGVLGSPHTLWRQLEHLRICQWDIFEYSTNANHISPDFPDGYWPSTNEPPTENAWDESVVAFRRDLESVVELIMNPKTDLFRPLPHGGDHTILREALLVADHNAYHIGQIIAMRRTLGIWD